MDADYSRAALLQWHKWALLTVMVMWALVAAQVWLAYRDWPPPVLDGLRGGIDLLLHGAMAAITIWFVIMTLGMMRVERRNGQWVYAEPRLPAAWGDRRRWMLPQVSILSLLWLPWGVSQFALARLFDT